MEETISNELANI